MAEVRGSGVYVSVDTTDISEHVNDSPLDQGADVHELTTYSTAARPAKRRKGGLQDNTYKLTGVYDNGATDTPRTLFSGKAGDTFAIVDRLEGTGTGKPERSFSAVLTKYSETKPVADYIRWSADFSVDGSITETTQA